MIPCAMAPLINQAWCISLLYTSNLLLLSSTMQATTNGFFAQQNAKAESYADMVKTLGLNNQEVLEYVKIRALVGEDRDSSQTVLGTAQPSLVYS